MKLFLHIFLFALAALNLVSLEPELYSPQDFTFEPYYYNELIFFNEEYYFLGTDDVNGLEIWKFDGTENGMEVFTILEEDAKPIIIDVIGEKLLFATTNSEGDTVKLWTTEGTRQTTTLITEIEYNYSDFVGLVRYSSGSFVYNQQYYFNIYSRDRLLNELWVTDVTDGNIFSYSEKYNAFDLTEFHKINDKLVTIGYNENANGQELYLISSDGERTMLAEYRKLYSLNRYLNTEENDLLFFYKDVYSPNNPDFSALWVTDGSVTGTIELLNENESIKFDYSKIEFRKFQDKYLITGERPSFVDGPKKELVITDGTKENQFLMTSVIPNEKIIDVKLLNEVSDRFLFEIRTHESTNIWSTDGTLEGTFIILHGEQNELTGRVYSQVRIEDNLIFIRRKDKIEFQLFETDGTAENTNHIMNLEYTLQGTTGGAFIISENTINDKVYIQQDNRNLYTYSLKDKNIEFIQSFDFSSGAETVMIDNTIYLVRGDSFYYFNKTKDKFEEIKPKNTPNETFESFNTRFLFNDYLYFLADYFDDGYKIYRIDNTFKTISNVETIQSGDIKYYPNPTDNTLNINVSIKTSISIINLNGKVVKRIDDYFGESIDISSLLTGVYSIILNNNTFAGKFVKK